MIMIRVGGTKEGETAEEETRSSTDNSALGYDEFGLDVSTAGDCDELDDPLDSYSALVEEAGF